MCVWKSIGSDMTLTSVDVDDGVDQLVSTHLGVDVGPRTADRT